MCSQSRIIKVEQLLRYMFSILIILYNNVVEPLNYANNLNLENKTVFKILKF